MLKRLKRQNARPRRRAPAIDKASTSIVVQASPSPYSLESGNRGKEVKCYRVDFSQTSNQTPVFCASIDALAQGTGGGQRVGDKILLKRVILQCNATPSGGVPQARLSILCDRDGFSNTASNYFVNAEYAPLIEGRAIKVLKDFWLSLGPGVQPVVFDHKFRGLEVRWDHNSGHINCNDVLVWIMTNMAANQPTFKGSVLFMFEDA